MSGRAMEWAHELAVDKRLAATVAHVLVRLAYHANSRTGRAWPAVDTLADECQLSGRAIQQALAVLERRPDPDTGEVAGYLEATRRHGYTTVWHFATWRAARRVYRTRGSWAHVYALREAERVRLNRPVIR